jgi:hypothetical protein
MIKIQIFDCLVDILDNQDPMLLLLTLDAIDTILPKWRNMEAIQSGELNEYALRLEEKGLDKIEAFQAHPNKYISMVSLKIIDTYFEMEEQPM